MVILQWAKYHLRHIGWHCPRKAKAKSWSIFLNSILVHIFYSLLVVNLTLVFSSGLLRSGMRNDSFRILFLPHLSFPLEDMAFGFVLPDNSFSRRIVDAEGSCSSINGNIFLENHFNETFSTLNDKGCTLNEMNWYLVLLSAELAFSSVLTAIVVICDASKKLNYRWNFKTNTLNHYWCWILWLINQK